MLSKYFDGYGYLRVDPPAIEFEESLFVSSGQALSESTFRIMDPLSHKMMGVRADMTLQIARIADTRLVNDEKPLRLSYSGDVFRVKGSGLYAERQFTQAGIELIGIDNQKADAEVVIIVLRALKKIGVKDICIDFNLPDLVDIIIENSTIDTNIVADLKQAIKRKDVGLIRQLAGEESDLLVKFAGTDFKLEDLAVSKIPDAAKLLFIRLSNVIAIIKDKVKDIVVSVDLLESAKFSYHCGIGFSIFAKGVNVEIGRGGRYVTDSNQCGIGVTLYITELLRVLPKLVDKEKILVPFDADIKLIEKLQKDGFIVINSLEDNLSYKDEARRLACKYIIDGNEPVKL
jgi:ATP phosphoribosyltransferase regulatory subunit